jgi:hypothetical protein
MKSLTIDGIQIEIRERRPGLFFATSPNVSGFFMSKSSLDELKTEIMPTLALLKRVQAENIDFQTE